MGSALGRPTPSHDGPPLEPGVRVTAGLMAALTGAPQRSDAAGKSHDGEPAARPPPDALQPGSGRRPVHDYRRGGVGGRRRDGRVEGARAGRLSARTWL